MYDESTSDYDVGIIKVSEGMTLDGTNAKAISMVGTGSDVTDGENVTITGWGATSVSSINQFSPFMFYEGVFCMRLFVMLKTLQKYCLQN